MQPYAQYETSSQFSGKSRPCRTPEQMLGFALGRNLEYYDQPTVEEISRALIRNEYSARALITEIVASYPFRFRRGAADSREESE